MVPKQKLAWILAFLPLLAIPIRLLFLYPPFQPAQPIAQVLDLPESELVSVDAVCFDTLRSTDPEQVKQWEIFLCKEENKILLVSESGAARKGWGQIRLNFADGSDPYINDWANPEIGKYSYRFVEESKKQEAIQLFLDTFAKKEVVE
ncbi:MAG: hypothetical protein HFJ84_04250 [Clostridiales bacterium]|jgi:hypothetical protein|nr:hypothetical protein [Clostridiales bacterium]